MWHTLLIVIYCALIAAVSLLGGWLPTLVRLTHTMTQVMMSFVGGLMLGVAVLHMMPHAAEELESHHAAAGWVLAGLLGTFLMMRWFHFHQHDTHYEEPTDAHDDSADGESNCDEPHEHLMSHLSHSDQPHHLSWVGLFFGLAVHTLSDGVALAASVAVGRGAAAASVIGLGTFLAILLHKPLDAFSITSVMVAAGWRRRWIDGVNLLFALMCPAGALCSYFAMQGFTANQNLVIGAALGFSGGVFLCISLADILPEVQFHRHDRWKLSAALLVGVLVAVLISRFEPEHTHASPNPQADSQHDHDHDH